MDSREGIDGKGQVCIVFLWLIDLNWPWVDEFWVLFFLNNYFGLILVLNQLKKNNL